MNKSDVITCEKAIETALLRTSHEASTEDIRKLKQHIKNCQTCKREVADINMAISAYRTTDKPEPSSVTKSNVITAVTGSQQAIKAKIPIMPKIIRLTASAVATAALVMFTFVGMNRPDTNSHARLPAAEALALSIMSESDLPVPESALAQQAGEDIKAATSMLDFLETPSDSDSYKKEREILDRQIFETLVDA